MTATDRPSDRNVEAVRARLTERAERGIEKYGTTTERGDLTHVEWLRHLQEELLDGAVYIEAAIAREIDAAPINPQEIDSKFIVEPGAEHWRGALMRCLNTTDRTDALIASIEKSARELMESEKT